MSTVLVTGGSGFLAGHIILQLLLAGHTVRATVRDLAREPGVRETLANAGATSLDQLSFFAADLTEDQGWAAAVASCDYVLHVASPFPSQQPKDENELIVPARDGTLRVLRAARDAGVKRVVMTSSFAAIGYGKHAGDKPYTEADWTDVDAPNPPYIRSKTIAERAAWDLMEKNSSGLELSVINPVGIFGPVLGRHISASIGIIKAMLEGKMPGMPDVHFGVVNVRDAADLHIRAMTSPAAAGERFLAVAGPALSMADVADILRRRLGEAASRVPTKKLPSWQVRLAALFDTKARQTVPNLGKRRNSSNEKARRVLRWMPRDSEEVIFATGNSLLQLGLINRD